MGLFGKKKKYSENIVPWRDKDGKLVCNEKLCPKECDKSCPIHMHTLAITLAQMGSVNAAIETYKKVLDVAPDFYDAWNNLAGFYGQKGEYQKAYECYLKARELNKEKPNPLYGLVLTTRDLGKYEECLKWCDEYDKIASNETIDNARRYAESQLSKSNISNSEFEAKAQECYDNLEEFTKTIIKKHSLTMPDIHEFINTDKFSDGIIAFCDECYADDPDRILKEYLISAYYAALCITLLHKADDKSFSPDDAYKYLQSKCDTEYCDIFVSRLLKIDEFGEESDSIWNIFSPFLSLADPLVKALSEKPRSLLKPLMESAYKLGMATANRYQKSDLVSECDYSGINADTSLLVGRNYYHYTNGVIDEQQPAFIDTDDIDLDLDDENSECEEVEETDHNHPSLKAFLPRDCWVKRISAEIPEIECYYIIAVETKESKISDVTVLLEAIEKVGGGAYLIVGENQTCQKDYKYQFEFPEKVRNELDLLKAGRFLPYKFSFIGKKLPQKIIKEDNSFALHSSYRSAYIDLCAFLDEDDLVEDFEYSTYFSTGSGYWDMFSRPQTLNDRKDEMIDTMLYIIDAYTDEEYAEIKPV